MTTRVSWYTEADKARRSFARRKGKAGVHPFDAALALSDYLAELAELQVLALRDLGRALEELEEHGGRPMPDEPLPERIEARRELGMHRTDLQVIRWLGALSDKQFARIVEQVRAKPPTRVWSLRQLHREFGGGG
jgi:hypothetical protein